VIYNYSNRNEQEPGLSVVKRGNEDIDSMIKRFKKKVNKSGLPRELKLKMQFEKPSVKKKRKRIEAQKRVLREQSKLIKNVDKNKKFFKKRTGGQDENDTGSK